LEVDVQVAFLEGPAVEWHTLLSNALEGVWLDDLACGAANVR